MEKMIVKDAAAAWGKAKDVAEMQVPEIAKDVRQLMAIWWREEVERAVDEIWKKYDTMTKKKTAMVKLFGGRDLIYLYSVKSRPWTMEELQRLRMEGEKGFNPKAPWCFDGEAEDPRRKVREELTEMAWEGWGAWAWGCFYVKAVREEGWGTKAFDWLKSEQEVLKRVGMWDAGGFIRETVEKRRREHNEGYHDHKTFREMFASMLTSWGMSMEARLMVEVLWYKGEIDWGMALYVDDGCREAAETLLGKWSGDEEGQKRTWWMQGWAKNLPWIEGTEQEEDDPAVMEDENLGGEVMTLVEAWKPTEEEKKQFRAWLEKIQEKPVEGEALENEKQ